MPRLMQEIDESARQSLEAFVEKNKKQYGVGKKYLVSLMIRYAATKTYVEMLNAVSNESPKPSPKQESSKPKPKSIDDLDPDTRAKAVAEIKAKYPGMFITPAAIMRHLNGESLDDLRGNA